MNLFSSIRLTLALNVFLVLATAFVLNSGLNYKDYTLKENGNWVSAKADLRGLNGVYAYLFTKTALSKNHLNVGAWLGYQELLYNKEINPREIRFSYLSPFNAPFSCILQRTDSVSHGIYFNYNSDSTCCFFIADREGRFLHKEIFHAPVPNGAKNWNEATATCFRDSLNFSINGKTYLQTSCKLEPSGHMGFRGGNRDVFIDDITVTDAEGSSVIHESFTPPFRFNLWTLLFIALFGGSIFFLQNPMWRSWITVINMSALIGVAVSYWVYFFFLSNRYEMVAENINWHGKRASYDDVEVVCNRIRRQHPLEERKPVILFIGSSQTWGAGITRPEKAFPARIEANLRNYFNDSSITILNGGVCGFTSGMAYDCYACEWQEHNPLLTVINLSTNDSDTLLFKENLHRFLALNQSRGIKTLLVAEPNDSANNFQNAKHRIMKTAGNLFNVKTVFAQSYLDSNSANGFIWWDYVHMTDYGYREFSEHLTPEIIKILEQDSLLLKFNSASAAGTQGL